MSPGYAQKLSDQPKGTVYLYPNRVMTGDTQHADVARSDVVFYESGGKTKRIIPASSTHETYDLVRSNELVKITDRLNRIEEKINEIIASSFCKESGPVIISAKIRNLPDDRIDLIEPISIIIKFFADEVIAVSTDLNLYAEGENEIQAIDNLKTDIIDLYDHLNEFGDDSLSGDALSWKKFLDKSIRHVD